MSSISEFPKRARAMKAIREEWLEVCLEADLVRDSGVCALVKGEQVALFLDSLGGTVHAVSNYDPFGKANVISRGIIGSLDGRVVVASPLYKQHFCLRTGECLEDEKVKLKTWPAKLEKGRVYLRA